MTPLQRFDYCISWLESSLAIIGYNNRSSYRPMVAVSFLAFFICCTINTIYSDKSVFVGIINCLSLSTNIQVCLYTSNISRIIQKAYFFKFESFVFLQLIVKIYYIRRKEDIDFLVATVRNMLKDSGKLESLKLQRFLSNFLYFIECGMKALTWTIYAMVFFMYIPTPIVRYLLYGTYQMILPVYLPGINATGSTHEYLITSSVHLIVLGFESIVIVAIEMLLLIILISPIIFAYLIGFHSNALNMDLESRNLKCNRIAKAMFRNILLMHQEMEM